jgi:hypothetical protein
MQELRFRLYSPTSETLREFQDSINMEPIEVLDLVQNIIDQAKANSPHLPETKLTLVPRKMDGDLKRQMKPQIDELLEETKDVLIRMRAAKRATAADPLD